jgi:uncharacterized surface anchored protein
MADILIGSAVTDENGLASFTGLPPGTYKYVQTGAATGYTADTAEYTIVISDSAPISVVRTNAPAETGSISVKKHVEGFQDYVLAGATFKLTDSSGKPLVSTSSATDGSGALVFENLMTITGTPQTYQLTEVAAPGGYEPNTNTYDIEVTAGQSSDQNVPNVSTVQGSLDITLSDANYEEYGLTNSGYNLFLVTP